MANEKVLARTVQLIHGVDMLGSRMSLTSKNGAELELTPLGIRAKSGKTGQTVLVPWSNVKGVDVSEGPAQDKRSKARAAHAAHAAQLQGAAKVEEKK